MHKFPIRVDITTAVAVIGSGIRSTGHGSVKDASHPDCFLNCILPPSSVLAYSSILPGLELGWPLCENAEKASQNDRSVLLAEHVQSLDRTAVRCRPNGDCVFNGKRFITLDTHALFLVFLSLSAEIPDYGRWKIKKTAATTWPMAERSRKGRTQTRSTFRDFSLYPYKHFYLISCATFNQIFSEIVL